MSPGAGIVRRKETDLYYLFSTIGLYYFFTFIPSLNLSRMKKYFFLLVFIGLSFTGNAQKNKMAYGFSTGVNLNSAYGNEALKKYSGTMAGLHVGGYFKVSMNEHFGLKAILAYDQNGYIYRSLTFSDVIGNDLGTGDLLEKLNYLNVPLLAEYTFGKKIKFYANAGVFAGYLLKYTIVRKIKEPVASVTKTTSNYRKSLNFGLSAGTGLQIPLTTTIKLDFGLSNNLGLANIYKPESTEKGTIRTNSFSILSGVTFNLK
jgi:hypothetical protein